MHAIKQTKEDKSTSIYLNIVLYLSGPEDQNVKVIFCNQGFTISIVTWNVNKNIQEFIYEKGYPTQWFNYVSTFI